MKNIYYKIKSILLTIFGDIKVFKYPMFIIYSPKGYNIKGEDFEKINEVITDGCVIMRSYKDYLDSFFIPQGESKCSHSGVYINGYVYHSIAEGVRKDRLFDFCKADNIVILQPSRKFNNKQLTKLYKYCEETIGVPYDFNFDDGNDDKSSNMLYNSSYYCHEFTQSCFPLGWNIERLSLKNSLGIKCPMMFVADSFYNNDKFDVIFEK